MTPALRIALDMASNPTSQASAKFMVTKHSMAADPRKSAAPSAANTGSYRISPWPGSVSVVEVVAGLQEGDLLILNKHHEVAIEQRVTARRASVGPDSDSSHPTDQ